MGLAWVFGQASMTTQMLTKSSYFGPARLTTLCCPHFCASDAHSSSITGRAHRLSAIAALGAERRLSAVAALGAERWPRVAPSRCGGPR